MIDGTIQWILLAFIAGCGVTFLVARAYFSDKMMKARIANAIDVTPTVSAIKKFRGMLPLLRTVVHDINEILEDLEEQSERLSDIEEMGA